MRFSGICTALLAAFVVPMSVFNAARAQEPPGILRFDLNGNGQIDAAEATPEFLTWVNRVFMPMPGVVAETPESGSEVPLPDDISPEDAAPDHVTVTVTEQTSEDQTASSDIAQEPVSKISRAMLLRRSVEEVSLTKTAAALDAADGAVVSYTNDVRQDTEEWQVQGSLLYPIRYETGRQITPGDLMLSAYTFVPSVSFDRKFHSADAASEIDSLVFRLGSEWEVSGGRIFPKQYFRLAPVYGTDFEFESSVVAGEFQYEVLKEKWGLGAPTPCFLARFECQWRAILHLEGGKTLDAGQKTNLVDDEEFLRAGPKLNAALQPNFSPFKRLELKAAWLYLEDLTSDSGATDLFESGISWRLDDNGHLRVRAQYRHGDLPLTRDKITIVTTGLEIKF